MWLPAGYAILGLAAVAAPGYEVFPFFCWFLFPVTPNQVERYVLKVERDRGVTFEPPVPYESSKSFGSLRNSMDLQIAAQLLGAALERGDMHDATGARKRIEANFLNPPCAYSIAVASYEPIERWRGSPAVVRAIDEFTCDEFR